MSTAFGTGVTGPDGRLLDQVRLSGVSARGYHGVLPSERQTGQEFRADVVLHMDTRAAAAGDDLAQTVSYADVAQDVHDLLTGEPADLVETVAERIAAAALAREQVHAVDVRVHKPHAPIPVPFADVEVAIRRDRVVVPVVAAPAALAGIAGVPEPQDFQAVARPGSEEPERLAQEPFEPEPRPLYEPEAPASYEPEAPVSYESDAPVSYEPEAPVTYEPEPPVRPAEPVVAELPAERLPSRAVVDEPEPVAVPELIAPAPLQVVPAAWELQQELQADAEQQSLSDQFDRGPVFQPEQSQHEPVFEPVQSPAQPYESVQGLDQWQPDADQTNGRSEHPAEPQQYSPFAQGQPEQQLDPQQNQYDQLFDQQYEQGDRETTRAVGALPDAPLGAQAYPQQEQFAAEQVGQVGQDQYPHEQFAQPEQFAQQEQFAQPEQYSTEQYAQEQYSPEQYVQEQQHEPRDRFDEVPAGYVDVVIAIGANLGDPQATMRSAVAELDRMPGLQITDVSPLARTAAVGGPDEQPDYLNAVLLARTELPARGLLHLCLEVESLHGRTREEHWGPRTLDVDLIAYGTLADAADDLELPHPRAHERAFVLEPWSQIAPDAVLPGLGGGPVAQLAATAPDRSGIRWLALDWLSDAAPEQAAGQETSADSGAVDAAPVPEQQEARGAELPPALPPSLPPSGRPQASSGGPVVEVPGAGRPQDGPGYPDQHPQAYSSGPVPGAGGSGQAPQQAPVAQRTPPPVGMNGSAVPPPEEALVPAPPIAPRAVRDTAHEEPERESLPAAAPAKPVFSPVNPSRQQSGVFPPSGGSLNGGSLNGGSPNGGSPNGAPEQQVAYDNDHTLIRVPGYATEQAPAPSSDGPIDSVPAWGPVRDERGRDV